LKDAIENGWEPFVIHQSRKDKVSGEKVEEEIEMPGSEQNEDGAYVFEGSITEKAPKGRQINHKEAMSLSKQRKDGGHESLAVFEASYVPEEAPAKPAKAVTKTVVVRKTAAEKAAEAEAKKAEKEAEKAEKKAAKEAERAEKKALKEAEKAAAKEAKEAEKALAKAAKEAEKAAKKAPAVKAPSKAKSPYAGADARRARAPAAPVKPAVKKADVVIPDDGAAHPWTFKGKKYLRSSANEVWASKADGSLGKWVGVYDPSEDKIDDSVPEPEFDDSE
jgi:membrane protein involved in colicin uptake